MPIEEVKVKRAVQVPVGDKVHTAEFVVKVTSPDGDCDALDDEQRRATILAEQGVEEFLKLFGGERKKPIIPTSVSARDAPEMFELVFDATNSKPHSDRIMRASSEEMSFELNRDGDGWICIDHNQRRFHVAADWARGLGRCDCEDFLKRGIKAKMPCKHIYALVISSERFWDPEDRKGGN